MKREHENCICDPNEECEDVVCPYHGQDALNNKTGFYTTQDESTSEKNFDCSLYHPVGNLCSNPGCTGGMGTPTDKKESRPDPFGDFMKTQGIKVVDATPKKQETYKNDEKVSGLRQKPTNEESTEAYKKGYIDALEEEIDKK